MMDHSLPNKGAILYLRYCYQHRNIIGIGVLHLRLTDLEYVDIVQVGKDRSAVGCASPNAAHL